MDRVYTSSDAMVECIISLQEMNDTIDSLTANFLDALESYYMRIDNSLHSDIDEMRTLVKKFGEEVKLLSDENIQAMIDRLNKLEDYSTGTFVAL